MLIGRFNPRIFQPMWFAARGLLAEGDVEPESIVVTDGLAAFNTRELTVLCVQDRCQFTTTATTPTPDILRDLVTETFTVLNETPIRQLGVNHQAHIPSAVRAWDTIVASLGDPDRRFVLLEGQRLQTVELRADRDDGRLGGRVVHLQPSGTLHGGVWFQLNDHVDLVDPSEQQEALGAQDAVNAITQIWEPSKALAEQILREIAPLR